MALAWQAVDSSNVERVAYHDDSRTLCVKFKNGGIYTYLGVGELEYQELIGAESVGRYLNSAIKGMYHYQRHETEQDLLSAL